MASSIDMQAVYENDFFEYEFGTDGFIKHRPTLKNRGEVIAYYAVAKLKNGGSVFKVMSKDECVEHGKTHSKSYTDGRFDKNSPWAKDLDAMCKKTVLLQLAKLMPKSVELQKALAMDNTTKSVFRPDMFEVKDETNWEDDTVVIPPTTDEAGE
jgi:recombination protein RecT